jgi:hypothetical protein
MEPQSRCLVRMTESDVTFGIFSPHVSFKQTALMKCSRKVMFVVATDHSSTHYSGNDKCCGDSDENGRAYLCTLCENIRKTNQRLMNAQRRRAH